MPITEHQRQQRTKHIGSSDTPQILGLSPWGSASDVYYSKVLPIEEGESTEAMAMGRRLEPVIIDWAEEQLGIKLRRNQYRVAPDGILAANFDAMVIGKREAVEAKYVGPNSVEEWGEPETDEVPVHVAAQVQHQMYVRELDVVWVPVLMARYRPVWQMYRVPRDDEIIGDLVPALLSFWREHVVPQIPPDANEPPPLEVLKRLKREPESMVELPEDAIELVDCREASKQQEKAAKARIDEVTRELVAMLGDAEAGRLPDGRLVTYRQRTRREYTVKASTFPVLRITKPKQETDL